MPDVLRAPENTRVPRRTIARAAGPLAAALAVLLLGAAVFGYTVDDAFIVGRYAARIASGHGYTFVDGPPTDGVTAPISLVPGVLAAAVDVDPVSAAKVTGLLLGALSAAALFDAARRRAIGRLGASVAAAFLCVTPSFVTWCVAGLEVGAAALACTVLAASVLNEPRPWRAAIAATALALLRPECAPLSLALGAYLVRRTGRRSVGAIAAPIALLAIQAGVRAWAFGAPGPLSLAAKPPDLMFGAGYALRVLGYGTALVGLVAAAHAVRGSRRMRALGAALVVHLGALVIAGGDWMPGVRLWAPVAPLLAWMVGIGVADLVRRTRSRALLVAALSVVLGAPAVLVAIDARSAIEAGRTREREGRALAAYLDAHATRVALIDVGFLSWVGHFVPIDLAGVTDPSIGRLPGAHGGKPVTGAMLALRGADAIVLHSATEPGVDVEGHLTSLAGHPLERRLATDETVRRAFRVADVRRYAEGYWYVVLLPR